MPTSTRCSRELDSRARAARGAARDDLRRRRHADAARPGAARSPARRAARRPARSRSRRTPRPSTTRSPRCWRGTARASRSARRASARASSQCSSGARRPDTVRGAVATLRRAGVANLNLDVLFGIPGETRAALDRDIDEALALEPDHLSCYELEAKPGTRFTFTPRRRARAPGRAARGSLRARHRAARGGGLPLVRDGELLPRRPSLPAQPRDLARARTTSASASAPSRRSGSCGDGTGRASRPTSRCSARGESPLRVDEQLTPDERLHERILLGLRLDEPMEIAPVRDGLDLRGGRPARRARADGRRRGGTLTLTRRGRMVANDVISRLITE